MSHPPSPDASIEGIRVWTLETCKREKFEALLQKFYRTLDAKDQDLLEYHEAVQEAQLLLEDYPSLTRVVSAAGAPLLLRAAACGLHTEHLFFYQELYEKTPHHGPPIPWSQLHDDDERKILCEQVSRDCVTGRTPHLHHMIQRFFELPNVVDDAGRPWLLVKGVYLLEDRQVAASLTLYLVQLHTASLAWSSAGADPAISFLILHLVPLEPKLLDVIQAFNPAILLARVPGGGCVVHRYLRDAPVVRARVLNRLLDGAPSAAGVADANGAKPLHLVMRHLHQQSLAEQSDDDAELWNVARRLVDLHPQALEERPMDETSLAPILVHDDIPLFMCIRTLARRGITTESSSLCCRLMDVRPDLVTQRRPRTNRIGISCVPLRYMCRQLHGDYRLYLPILRRLMRWDTSVLSEWVVSQAYQSPFLCRVIPLLTQEYHYRSRYFDCQKLSIVAHCLPKEEVGECLVLWNYDAFRKQEDGLRKARDRVDDFCALYNRLFTHSSESAPTT